MSLHGSPLLLLLLLVVNVGSMVNLMSGGQGTLPSRVLSFLLQRQLYLTRRIGLLATELLLSHRVVQLLNHFLLRLNYLLVLLGLQPQQIPFLLDSLHLTAH